MINQTLSEIDCRMVQVQIECPICKGKCTVKRLVPVATMNSGGFAEIDVECANCEGSGEITVERCNNCQQGEEECTCLDSVEFVSEAQSEMEEVEYV